LAGLSNWPQAALSAEYHSKRDSGLLFANKPELNQQAIEGVAQKIYD
jgi:hypothetical protein